MKNIAEIGQVIKQFFILLGSMIDPDKRREAYSLHLTKRQQAALDYAERYILEAGVLIEWMSDYLETIDKSEKKQLKKDRRYLDKLKKSFFKYN